MTSADRAAMRIDAALGDAELPDDRERLAPQTPH